LVLSASDGTVLDACEAAVVEKSRELCRRVLAEAGRIGAAEKGGPDPDLLLWASPGEPRCQGPSVRDDRRRLEPQAAVVAMPVRDRGGLRRRRRAGVGPAVEQGRGGRCSAGVGLRRCVVLGWPAWPGWWPGCKSGNAKGRRSSSIPADTHTPPSGVRNDRHLSGMTGVRASTSQTAARTCCQILSAETQANPSGMTPSDAPSFRTRSAGGCRPTAAVARCNAIGLAHRVFQSCSVCRAGE
jgi:hypothetical protein